MAPSIYDSCMRDELRLYTRELLDLVCKHYKVDIDDFIDKFAQDDGIANDVPKCKACCKTKGGVTKLCLKPVVGDSEYCEAHCGAPQVKTNDAKKTQALVLEYVRTSKGEFLYDPETLNVYAYETGPCKPTLIGKMDEETRTIVVA